MDWALSRAIFSLRAGNELLWARDLFSKCASGMGQRAYIHTYACNGSRSVHVCACLSVRLSVVGRSVVAGSAR